MRGGRDMEERQVQSVGTDPQAVTGTNKSGNQFMKNYFTVNGSSAVANEFKTKLNDKGLTEVKSTEQCDFILAFCPMNTRVAIDIQETMEKCRDGKPVILVLLHHTFDPEKYIYRDPETTALVSITLSVDLRFHDDRLLQCPHNKGELNKVLDLVGWRPSKIMKERQVQSVGLGVAFSDQCRTWKRSFMKKINVSSETASAMKTSDDIRMNPQAVTGTNKSGNQFMKNYFTVNGSSAVANEFKTKLKRKGLTEVKSTEQWDFILAFCPMNTRVGIDIQETMEKCRDGKPVILVLLHHTFDPEKCIYRDPETTALDSIILSVDLLFYDDRLHQCPPNEGELNKVLDHVGCPPSKPSLRKWFPKLMTG